MQKNKAQIRVHKRRSIHGQKWVGKYGKTYCSLYNKGKYFLLFMNEVVFLRQSFEAVYGPKTESRVEN